MLDPLVILQGARNEAMKSISIIDDPNEWHFMYDLLNRIIDHVAGLSPHVQITHQQPVVAALDAAEEIDQPQDSMSTESLQRLISTMSEWSMKQPWTPEQMAAWRLRWFGRTPEMDRDARDVIRHHERYGDDEPRRWEPQDVRYPNGQGLVE